MANIQIPSTIVAGTGTGALMNPYKLIGDTAVYREASPVAVPAMFTLKRTEPKPTKDYAGAAKTDAKFNRTLNDPLGRAWPLVATLSVSVPVFLTDTQKSAFVNEAILAFSVDVTRSALATQVIPQS